MPLKVVSSCAYLAASPYPAGHPNVYDACKFVKAIKGDTLRGYAHVPVRGKKRRLEQSNRDDAIKWFGWLAGDWIEEDDDVEAPLVVIPVPGSSNIITSRATPRTTLLANAIGATLVDILRWKRDLGKTRTGAGSRNTRTLYNNLQLTRIPDLQDNPDVVLIDDVMTTGAHLRAVASFLARKCRARVVLALCAGKTVHEEDGVPDNCFEPIVEELEDFAP